MSFDRIARRVIVESGISEYAITPQYVVDYWIGEAYKEIVSQLRYADINKQANDVITTVAQYNTGTVAITQGSVSVVGTGTTFTAAMIGRFITFGSSSVWYKIAAVPDATTLTLDDAVVDNTNTGLGFVIAQRFYEVDANLRWITDAKLMGRYDLIKTSQEKLDEMFPARLQRPSLPQYWAPAGYNTAQSARLIEIFPPSQRAERIELTGYLNVDEPTLATQTHPDIGDTIVFQRTLGFALRFKAQRESDNPDHVRALLALASAAGSVADRLVQELLNRAAADRPQPRIRVRIGEYYSQRDPIMTAEDEVFYRSPYN
jgi:hypothetical protein